jgi:REP element-mobilizing transposase RayT
MHLATLANVLLLQVVPRLTQAKLQQCLLKQCLLTEWCVMPDQGWCLVELKPFHDT